MIAFDIDLLVVTDGTDVSGARRRSLARSVASGRLLRLRRGVYLETAVWESLDVRDRHVLRMRALDAVVQHRPVFSHRSAAVALGLPLLQDVPELVDVLVPPGVTRSVLGVRAHPLPVTAADLVERGGLLITSWARTVVDVAAGLDFDEGVVVADAALRERGLVSASGSADLAAAWERAAPRKAHRRVEEVLRFADGRAESVGESVSRVTMRVLRLPAPVLQQPFRLLSGRTVRPDFWFPAQRAMGEMDGRGKYLDPTMNHGDAARAVYEEKRREDELRRLAAGFARWDFRTARSPRLLAQVLAAAGVGPLR